MIRKTLFHCALLLALAGGVKPAMAQGTAAFSYQGKLSEGGSPATGIYDFQFNLYDVAASTYRRSVATDDVGVSNGVFSVTLDFGATWFDGRQLMMLVQVRPGNSTGSYTNLLPLQPILPAPYAIHAASATTVANAAIGTSQLAESAVTGNKIASGQVVKSLNGLKDNVTLAAGANVTITPSGNTLTVSSSGGAFSLNGASAYYNGGSVGIGTINPQAKLHVAGGDILAGPAGQEWIFHTRYNTGGDFLQITDRENGVPQWQRGLTLNQSGRMGIGTANPQSALHVYSSENPATLRLQSQWGFGSGRVEFWSDPQGQLNEWRPGFIQSEDRGNFTGELVFYVNGSGAANKTNVVEALRLSEGKATVKVLTITGGADLAEPFQVSTKGVPKGAVMVIDEENSGHLKMSESAYDSRVAGIISGAGGVNPGITLRQEGVLEGGQNVALSGRVYVQADASEHPIKPGDLLTTSDVPGHAMKALNRDLAQGAILGKAMTVLEGGRGLVLVLVSLQ